MADGDQLATLPARVSGWCATWPWRCRRSQQQPWSWPGTDLVAALPRRVSEALCQLLPVRFVELPAGAPRFPLGMLWHERTHHDPAARYLRELVVRAVAAAAPSAPKRSAKRK
jgi:hypothetical protein